MASTLDADPGSPQPPPLQPEKRVSQVRLQPALSEITRKERKSLLAASLAALTVVKVGLVPTKISALGIDFSPADQRALLGVASLIISYFLVTFAIYALNDYMAWWHSLDAVLRDWEEYRERRREVGASGPNRRIRDDLHRRDRFPAFAAAIRLLNAQTRPVALLRNVLDFLVPLAFGLYVLIITLAAALGPVSAVPNPSAATTAPVATPTPQ